MSAEVELDEVLQSVADAVASHGEAFSRAWRIGFQIRGEPEYVLDVATGEIRALDEGASTEVDATMTANLPSLAALAAGTFDPKALQPGMVCVLSGERRAWEELADALARG